MSMAVGYERTTGTVVFNLSASEPPSPGVRGGNVPTGILAECFLGSGDSNLRIHYRE